MFFSLLLIHKPSHPWQAALQPARESGHRDGMAACGRLDWTGRLFDLAVPPCSRRGCLLRLRSIHPVDAFLDLSPDPRAYVLTRGLAYTFDLVERVVVYAERDTIASYLAHDAMVEHLFNKATHNRCRSSTASAANRYTQFPRANPLFLPSSGEISGQPRRNRPFRRAPAGLEHFPRIPGAFWPISVVLDEWQGTVDRCREMPVKASEAIRKIEAEGWFFVVQRGSYRQYKHRSMPGRVTIPGNLNDELHPGTWRSILKQAGLKHG